MRHHFRLGNVITTVDALNATPASVAQPREASSRSPPPTRLVITKTDLAEPDEAAAVREMLGAPESVGRSAGRLRARRSIDRIACSRHLEPLRGQARRADAKPGRRASSGSYLAGAAPPQRAGRKPEPGARRAARLDGVRHLAQHAAQSPRRQRAAREGHPAGARHVAPVFINAVQHIVHPPAAPGALADATITARASSSSRAASITRLLRRSLAAFSKARVADVSTV